MEQLEGSVPLLETSEELPSADSVRRWVRALGERGMLAAVVGEVRQYNPDAVICVGPRDQNS